MNDPSEVDDLIARCLDGGASEEEAAKLNALIERDPMVARALARIATFDSDLEVVARTHPHRTPAALAPAWRKRTRWVAVFTAAAAALMLGVVSRRRAPNPPAPATTPSTAAAARGTAATPALDAAGPAPGDARRVRFNDGSFAELRGAAARLEIRIATPSLVDVTLVHGGARFEVVPRPGRRFRVSVGPVYVEVIGTIFSVDRLAGAVRVSVERGLVKVISGHTTTSVAAGNTHVVGLESPRAAAVKDEVGEWLAASEVARRNRHPAAALALLQRVLDRHHDDPRAPYGAFIMGRVLLEELARPREAAAAFARVELLDPKTPLVEDALAREVESWAKAGDEGKARTRGATYLSRYPNGQRVDEVRRYSRIE